jgi:hypothetical protein
MRASDFICMVTSRADTLAFTDDSSAGLTRIRTCRRKNISARQITVRAMERRRPAAVGQARRHGTSVRCSADGGETPPLRASRYFGKTASAIGIAGRSHVR